MGSFIKYDDSDDPEFVKLVENVANKRVSGGDYAESWIITVKNWFDHKWLKFSGIGRVPSDSLRDSHPQVALDSFWQEKTTFPPFTPNRVLRQQWFPVEGLKRTSYVHDTDFRERSSWNLQRRVLQFADVCLFIWLSSGTKGNDRGSLMVYEVHDGSVSAWYASFKKTERWGLNLTKGIARDRVESMLTPPTDPSSVNSGEPATVD